MSQDKIHLNIAQLGERQPLAATNPDSIISVPVSEMRDYLDDIYGPEFPKDPTERYTTNTLLGSLTVLSTDHEMYRAFGLNPMAALPLWLRDVNPVVENTRLLGRRVDHGLQRVEANTKVLDNDLTFTAGLFDATSFVISAILGINHPRLQSEGLAHRSRLATPEGHRFVEDEGAQADQFFDLINKLGLVRKDYLKTVNNLRKIGAQIIKLSERETTRLLKIISDQNN